MHAHRIYRHQVSATTSVVLSTIDVQYAALLLI